MIKVFLFSAILFSNVLFAQQTVVLKTGEKMTGQLKSLNDGTFSFAFNGLNKNIKMSEVSVIYFEDKTATATSPEVVSGTKGVTYVMNGRKLTKQPKIDNLTMEKGVVVVNITIDKYGHVTKAEPGGEGTTTTSNYLLTKAKQAAESVQFDTSPTMPLQQQGSITITF